MNFIEQFFNKRFEPSLEEGKLRQAAFAKYDNALDLLGVDEKELMKLSINKLVSRIGTSIAENPKLPQAFKNMIAWADGAGGDKKLAKKVKDLKKEYLG